MNARRRRTQKTSVKNRRRIVRRRPTARNQKRQILSNQNQIAALRRHVNLGKERCRWHMGFHGVMLTAYPMIIPLTSGPTTTAPATTNTLIAHNCAWNLTMTPQPQKSNFMKSKVVVNSQWVDLTIYGGNEDSTLQFTAFLVQLREGTARQTYEETSQMSSMTRNSDFVTTTSLAGLDTGYGAYMNTDKYNIIKRLEFETFGPQGEPGGYNGATGDTGRGTRTGRLYRTNFKVNYGNTVLKSSGDAESLGTLEYNDIAPHTKRFIVIFSDNGMTDGQGPECSISSLITGYVAE